MAAPDALSVLRRASNPDQAAKLTRGQLVAALRSAHRHHVDAKAEALLKVLRAPALRQPATLQGAYASVVLGQVTIIAALNNQIAGLQEVMAEHFGRHPDAEIYLSQPGFGVMLAARTLGEFGDDQNRFASSRARKHYSGQSPITRASGKKSVVLARYGTNRRLGAALHLQDLAALGDRREHAPTTMRCVDEISATTQPCVSSPTGWSAYCTAASSRGTVYDENTAWPQKLEITTEPVAA